MQTQQLLFIRGWLARGNNKKAVDGSFWFVFFYFVVNKLEVGIIEGFKISMKGSYGTTLIPICSDAYYCCCCTLLVCCL